MFYHKLQSDSVGLYFWVGAQNDEGDSIEKKYLFKWDCKIFKDGV